MTRNNSLLFTGFIGLFLIIFSSILSFDIFKHYTVFFVLGWMFLMAFINRLWFGKSDLVNLKNKFFFTLLLLTGTIITLLIEFACFYLSAPWVYSFDFFDLKFDFWFSIGAYIFLIPATFETYTLLLNITKTKTKHFFYFNRLFIFLLPLFLFLMSLPLIWQNSYYQGLPFPFFIIGFFLISDFLSYSFTNNSIILNSLASLKYFLVVILTTFLISIPIEYLNINQYVWKYIELPFLDITLFGVPLIILIGWVPLVGILINIYKFILYFSRDKIAL